MTRQIQIGDIVKTNNYGIGKVIMPEMYIDSRNTGTNKDIKTDNIDKADWIDTRMYIQFEDKVLAFPKSTRDEENITVIEPFQNNTTNEILYLDGFLYIDMVEVKLGLFNNPRKHN